ncbi:MAG: hypothetical protein FWE82_09305, partial [Defluviitaleaceae bacterium]|nr:hypothetical protein [Defluviitaleaceae bacterium]
MKKIISSAIVIVLVFIVSITGCGTSVYDGADIVTADALAFIMEHAKENRPEDVFIPMTFDLAVSDENCESMLGLTPDQLERYVDDGSIMVAAIMTQAFQLALVKCNSSADAIEVKKLISNGFDPH